MMKTIVTFGEVLMRLSPPGAERFRQVIPGNLMLTFGGAEANVAAAMAQWGAPVRLVTALPTHAIADACVGFYKGLGVDTTSVLRKDTGRLGIYFYETGAGQRPGQVIYDREGSTICNTRGPEYDWGSAFDHAGALFISGITPGLSAIAAEATLQAATEARQRGVKVFCDLNFRRKLWRWHGACDPGKLANEVMSPLIRQCDYLIGNTGAAADIFSLCSKASSQAEASLEVAQALSAQFPNLTQVAMTMRESLTASHNRWSAMVYDTASRSVSRAPEREGGRPYEVTPIVDRVGAGDAFSAGLIYAMNTPVLQAEALAFATAASCLAHSISGDVCYTSVDEVRSMMKDGGAGYVVR